MVWAETGTTGLFWRCDELVSFHPSNGIGPIEREMNSLVQSERTIGDVEG